MRGKKRRRKKNEVNINMKCSRKKYFSDKLLETKGDVNGTWKVLNSALGKRSKTTHINSCYRQSGDNKSGGHSY